MALTFPVRPSSPLPELAQACIELVPQLQRKISVIKAQSIAAASGTFPYQAVAHGLEAVPLSVIPVPHTHVDMWVGKPADERFVYLSAASPVVCDIVVIS